MEPRPPWSPAVDPAREPVEPEPGATDPAPEAVVDEPVASDPGAAPPAAPAPPDAATDPAPPADGRPALDLDAVTADLAAVEAALERLDQGSYGRCGACASAIDDDVLAADPTATTCAAHLPV